MTDTDEHGLPKHPTIKHRVSADLRSDGSVVLLLDDVESVERDEFGRVVSMQVRPISMRTIRGDDAARAWGMLESAATGGTIRAGQEAI